MTLEYIGLFRYQIALHPSLPVASQRIDQRQGLVLHLATATASTSVEIAPLSGLDEQQQPLSGFSRETLAEVEEQLQQLLPTLLHQATDNLLDKVGGQYPSLDYGLSLAHAKLSGLLQPARIAPESIGLFYGLPDESDADVQERLTQFLAHYSGHFLKIKVGHRPWPQDLALIYQVLARRPHLRLRLDANQQYSLADAIDFCASLPHGSIDYIEEPCAHPIDSQTVYQATGIGFALDETLCQPNYHYQAYAGLSALVLKPMLIGDLARLQTMINSAAQDGVRCVLSSALESSLGIHDLIDLSAQLTPDDAPGVDTLRPFSHDLLVASAAKPCLTLADLTPVLTLGQRVTL
ncbi:o-succinylbenzoate synthase [Shewanella sp. NIFS-20-20]|uniref:o-succinylbenzoate synthase n=1 Tax=Shewanella sp. NIFS-20-20 TaxID=2853806 RepID=UPI001C460209|nr:o-succinylbenzoate synthase [Shewanella sp. NIFS-20-20]MBV7316316.1 o-succinylbenzoate synthase [Shewanella sp. NIFS-20-20]